MPSTASPYGLIPVNHPSGVVRPFAMSIVSGYANNIFQNQPVKIDTDGNLVPAAAGDAFIGSFQGVEFTDSDGRRRVSNKWTTGTVATEIVAYVTIDQTITYQIQSNAALAVADIGKQYDFSAAAGNTITGLSSQSLNVASSAANAGLRLIGIVPGPDNNWGDTFVNALVQISEHQNTANIAAY
ncbi:MAG: hypothetical protein RJA99_1414 [Pseudomonadota bacterium]|jgi:hypothetical protein